MIRAFKLEWLKVRNYKVFWILLGMYLLALLTITSLGVFFLEWLKSKGADIDGLDPTLLPIYDFPDIWQNTTFLAGIIKVLLAFIVIISVSNDLSYNTLRQNVIDGISKWDYLISKFMLILFLALLSTGVLFTMGLINGSVYSHVFGSEYIFDELEFLFAYAYGIIVFCMMAFLLTLIIKKAGFVIVFVFLYALMFEPILMTIFTHSPIKDYTSWAVPYFPVRTLYDMIPIPFPKYIFREIEDNVPVSAVAISTGWLIIYASAIIYILRRRDLK